ncbi:serine/threonine protein phosphatase [Candidatus Micrarchaeota archaeon]|nr:serine/threonine protein phosphatase [Candidatus Micrarchaeota archaeon]
MSKQALPRDLQPRNYSRELELWRVVRNGNITLAQVKDFLGAVRAMYKSGQIQGAQKTVRRGIYTHISFSELPFKDALIVLKNGTLDHVRYSGPVLSSPTNVGSIFLVGEDLRVSYTGGAAVEDGGAFFAKLLGARSRSLRELDDAEQEVFPRIAFDAKPTYRSITHTPKTLSDFFSFAKTIDARQFEDLVLDVESILANEQKTRGYSGARVECSLVSLSREGKAVFVGDLHGDFDSLFRVLSETNFVERVSSGEKISLVALGDYIDRGDSSVGVLALLLDLKRAFPENVFLLRGDHEVEATNKYGEFDQELTRKFKARGGKRLYSLVNKRVFDRLPFALHTGSGVLVLHGGVPQGVFTLAELASLDGEKLAQLVWNEPKKGLSGFALNETRGAFRFFGADVLRAFLAGTHSTVLIRGHSKCGKTGYATFSRLALTLQTHASNPGGRAFVEVSLETDASMQLLLSGLKQV